MQSSRVLGSSADGIVTVTINRPQKANALGWETIREFKEAIESARDKSDTRVVVIYWRICQGSPNEWQIDS